MIYFTILPPDYYTIIARYEDVSMVNGGQAPNSKQITQLYIHKVAFFELSEV